MAKNRWQVFRPLAAVLGLGLMLLIFSQLGLNENEVKAQTGCSLTVGTNVMTGCVYKDDNHNRQMDPGEIVGPAPQKDPHPPRWVGYYDALGYWGYSNHMAVCCQYPNNPALRPGSCPANACELAAAAIHPLRTTGYPSGMEWGGAVWQGRFTFDQGTYVFQLRSDDGSRLYIDGRLVLDNWGDHAEESKHVEMKFGPGFTEHTLKVEYHNSIFDAILFFNFSRLNPELDIEPVSDPSIHVDPVAKDAFIKVGQKVRFKAMFDPDGPKREGMPNGMDAWHYTDKPPQDVTSLAEWSSNNSSVAAATATKGEFEGKAVGDARVQASFDGGLTYRLTSPARIIKVSSATTPPPPPPGQPPPPPGPVGNTGSFSMHDADALHEDTTGAAILAAASAIASIHYGVEIAPNLPAGTPVLNVSNLTASRNPPSLYFNTDKYRVRVTNAKPNTRVFLRAIIQFDTPPPSGIFQNQYVGYTNTDANGSWTFDTEFYPGQTHDRAINNGLWRVTAKVDAKESNTVEFRVVSPTSGSGGSGGSGGTGSGTCSQPPTGTCPAGQCWSGHYNTAVTPPAPVCTSSGGSGGTSGGGGATRCTGLNNVQCFSTAGCAWQLNPDTRSYICVNSTGGGGSTGGTCQDAVSTWQSTGPLPTGVPQCLPSSLKPQPANLVTVLDLVDGRHVPRTDADTGRPVYERVDLVRPLPPGTTETPHFSPTMRCCDASGYYRSRLYLHSSNLILPTNGILFARDRNGWDWWVAGCGNPGWPTDSEIDRINSCISSWCRGFNASQCPMTDPLDMNGNERPCQLDNRTSPPTCAQGATLPD